MYLRQIISLVYESISQPLGRQVQWRYEVS